MITDDTFYWLMLAPVAFFLFCLASFLYSLRYEAPGQREGGEVSSPFDEAGLPSELHRALNQIRNRGGHVEVSRDNGKLTLTIDPADSPANGSEAERRSSF